MGYVGCLVLPVAAAVDGVPPGASERALVEDGAVGTEEGPPLNTVRVAADVEDLTFGALVSVVA